MSEERKYEKHQLDESDPVIALMLLGNPNCTHKIGSRIVKCVNNIDPADNDTHRIGDQGTVKGNCHATAIGSAYLVHFDNDPEEQLTFIIEGKIKAL